MDAICKLQRECIGQSCPLVSLYPSVFTLLANYSVLQTQMNINQAGESVEVFPSVIKQWFKVWVVKTWCCEFTPLPSRRNTRHHLIGVIYGLWGSMGWLGLGPPTARKTVGVPIRMAGKPWPNLSNNWAKSISVWRRVRHMTCLVFWYISGTFGHTAFVSFGDTTLNSWSPGHVMCWSAEVPKAKLNIQLALLGFSTTYLCKWCHCVSIKLLILKVEQLCSTAAVDIFWHPQTNGVLKKYIWPEAPLP